MTHLSGWDKQGGVLAILPCSRTECTPRASNKGEALRDLANDSRSCWTNFFNHSRRLLIAISPRTFMCHVREIFDSHWHKKLSRIKWKVEKDRLPEKWRKGFGSVFGHPSKSVSTSGPNAPGGSPGFQSPYFPSGL